LSGKKEKNLRQEAENKVRLQQDFSEDLSKLDLKKLVHELQVHQIELEMQNDELRKIQHDLKKTRDQYEELFNEAPIGYLIIDTTGKILNVNETLTGILASRKKDIIGHSFYEFIADEYKDLFYLYLRKLQNTGKGGGTETCLKDSGHQNFVYLSSSFIKRRNIDGEVRISVLDITQRKRAEVELRESRQRLSNLSAHILSVKENESKRIARIIHDEIGQNLFGLQMQVVALERELSSLDQGTTQKIKHILNYIDQIIETAQKVTSELRPPVLDNLGLKEAFRIYLKEFDNQIKINFQTNLNVDEFKMDIEKSTALFRIFQEVLLNIHRHAGATVVNITLAKNGNEIELLISDNGKGITPSQLGGNRSFGIMGMRERVNILKGKIDIKGKAGQGTIIKINIPLEQEQTEDD
jgi:PAS domain S-box-containing protein